MAQTKKKGPKKKVSKQEPRKSMKIERSESYAHLVWRQFKKRKMNVVALVVLIAIILVAAFADFLASDKPIYVEVDGDSYWFPNQFDEPDLRIYNNQLLEEHMGPDDFAVFPMVPWGYNSHDLENVLAKPSDAHWLGTDPSGRDVLSRVIHGTRISLIVGLVAVIILTVIGVFLGSLAGYYGGWIDGAINRVIEIIVSIPTILLIPTIMAVIFASGWTVVFAMMTVIGLVRWTTVARLVRAEILRIKNLEYVSAARALGVSTFWIIVRHMLPNAFAPVLVAIPFAMASAILLESALSFLGFGIPDDLASWGGALNGVRTNYEAWWLAVFPGFAIFLTVTAYNLAGEGLRDAIDPRLKT